jgi:hypothetical protein
MAEEKVEPGAVNIRQMLPWTELFQSFKVALDPKKLLLAAAGILVMAVGWYLLAWIFYSSQPEPQWPSYFSQSAPKDDSPEAAKHLETAWKTFKEDRRKWHILHDAAGSGPVEVDAGDLANSPTEYDEIQKALEDMKAKGDHELVVGDKRIALVPQPGGYLRTWPWFEDRGPNPYLLLTGGAAIPDNRPLAEWLIKDETGVLLEPLKKFLYPVVYLLHPRSGGWNRLYFLLVTLWTLGTWALFGGAITRMASVQVARNDKIGIGEAIRFVMARYYSFLSAPLFPLLFIAFMVVLLLIYGLFFMIPVLGDILIAGLGWPLIFLAGLAMAVVLVGLVGWPMMYATISAEGSDSFDAISRSYSYVYQSPWHYAWYSLVALAYGAVVVFFVGFMGSLVVYLGKWGVAQTPFIESANRDPSFLFVYAPTSFHWRELLLQGGTVDGQSLVENNVINKPAYDKLVDSMTWYNRLGAFMVTIWLWLFFLLVLGFGYSYFWTASTIIYLLMRRKVDDTDLDEVYLEEDEGEESYSASTSVPSPAPATAPPTGGTLQMVDAPVLRTSSPPPTSAATSEPAPGAESKEAPAPAGGDGNPPTTGEGAGS